MTKAQIEEALRLHSRWLDGDSTGSPVDLQGANLRGVDLRGANLYGVKNILYFYEQC